MQRGSLINCKIIPIFCVGFISVSHIFLPLFSEGRDFFVFTTWSLFSGPVKSQVYDITWEAGSQRLIRDHWQEARSLGVNIHTLFYLLNNQNIERIQRDYCAPLKLLSNGHELYFETIPTSLTNYLFNKSVISSSHQLEICRD
jgi:hypothetical protein